MAMKVTYTVLDGEIISENRNGVERDYMPDPQGNTLALLDNSQTKTDTFSYWPYGEVKSRTGTTPTPFQYIGTRGYYQDSSTKTYVRARYLDTQKGRWMTVDPIGFDGGWNLYGYCHTNPITYIDPSGLNPACIGCGLCVGIGVIGSIIACTSDPKGYFHCLACWCRKHPILCNSLIIGCAAICTVCEPSLGPVLGKLRPVPVPVGAFAANFSADPCDDKKEDKNCLNRWTACQGACDGLYYCNGKPKGVKTCCYEFCRLEYMFCEGKSANPPTWDCGRLQSPIF